MKYSIFLCFFFFSQNLFSQIELATDRVEALYRVGESVNFRITSNQTGVATYKLFYDRFVPVLATGTINLTAGQTFTLP